MSRSLRSEGFNQDIVSFRARVRVARAGEAKRREGVRSVISVAGVGGTKISYSSPLLLRTDIPFIFSKGLVIFNRGPSFSLRKTSTFF